MKTCQSLLVLACVVSQFAGCSSSTPDGPAPSSSTSDEVSTAAPDGTEEISGAYSGTGGSSGDNSGLYNQSYDPNDPLQLSPPGPSLPIAPDFKDPPPAAAAEPVVIPAQAAEVQ